MMEAAAGDIVFEHGRFTIAGTDRSVGIDEVARQSFHTAQSAGRHRDRVSPSGRISARPMRRPSRAGAHVCEVEIDPETGEVALTRYCAVDDVGAMLNPLLCEGQIHGGIVQGVGQALMENMVYDPESGQLLTGSFQDYCMPRADDFCDFELANNPTLTGRNPLGVKGVGEAGTIGAIPAVMNAVNDALAASARRGRAAGDPGKALARPASGALGPRLTGCDATPSSAMPEIDPAPRLGGTLSISRSLQALAVVVVVLIVAATVHQLLTGRATILADTEHQMSRLDMVFAEQTGRAVETVDFILRNSIDAFASLHAKPPIDAGAYDDWLRRRIAGVRQVREVAITDKNGDILFSSRSGPTWELSPAVRTFVAEQAAHPDARLHFSDPLHGPDGQWTALMVRAIPSHDGCSKGPRSPFSISVISRISIGLSNLTRAARYCCIYVTGPSLPDIPTPMRSLVRAMPIYRRSKTSWRTGSRAR